MTPYFILLIQYHWTHSQQHCNSFLNEISLTQIYFLCKEQHGLLALKSPRQHFSTILGEHFKQQNNNLNHKNAKNMVFSATKMTPLLHRAVTRRQSVTLFNFSLEHAYWLRQSFCCSEPVYVREWPQKQSKYQSGGYKLTLASALAHTEFKINGNWLYFISNLQHFLLYPNSGTHDLVF
jgi:hypothetical protein